MARSRRGPDRDRADDRRRRPGRPRDLRPGHRDRHRDASRPSSPDWRALARDHRRDCRFVARLDGRVVGWTALGRYSSREVYAGVAWESVYVDAGGARSGRRARRCSRRSIPASEAAGVWTLIAGVQAENAASLALHERAGFRRIGVQERVGRDPPGRWRDVVLLERRSAVVGI